MTNQSKRLHPIAMLQQKKFYVVIFLQGKERKNK